MLRSIIARQRLAAGLGYSARLSKRFRFLNVLLHAALSASITLFSTLLLVVRRRGADAVRRGVAAGPGHSRPVDDLALAARPTGVKIRTHAVHVPRADLHAKRGLAAEAAAPRLRLRDLVGAQQPRQHRGREVRRQRGAGSAGPQGMWWV